MTLFVSIGYGGIMDSGIKMDQKILFPDEPNGQTSYHFGRAVAIDGDYAAIGAYNSSAIYVYKRDSGTKLLAMFNLKPQGMPVSLLMYLLD